VSGKRAGIASDWNFGQEGELGEKLLKPVENTLRKKRGADIHPGRGLLGG